MIDSVMQVLEPFRPACDQWCLLAWETAGVWLSGLATFAAVVVSLLLARRDRIHLKISAGHRILIGPGSTQPYPQLLSILIRNVGTRPATVESIAWRKRPWRKLHGLQTFHPTAGYPGPPANIQPGQSHNFMLPLDAQGVEWVESFLRDFVGRPPWIGVHFVRVIAYTPAGDQFSASMESSLKKWLLEEAKRLKATHRSK
jgi:hypothetical protein